MDETSCPTCRGRAQVLDRTVLESTDGPIEHLRIRCRDGHFFFLPVGHLDRYREPAPGVPRGVPVGVRRAP